MRRERRKHPRRASSIDQTIKLEDSKDVSVYMILVDVAEGGIGLIYNGSHPPKIGYTFTAHIKEELRQVEVIWVQKLNKHRHRIGMMFI
ncbi:MAG: hypothetical protein GY847_14115 [Proteobacteria bacterium]|nr:hypothetical protein [Pseudomonadota bacterium]